LGPKGFQTGARFRDLAPFLCLPITLMEVFLQRAFIVGQKALTIKGSIPPKPRRQKAKKAT
jgi:hypothetical protein